MNHDPNQQYPGQHGQPEDLGSYQRGYRQRDDNSSYAANQQQPDDGYQSLYEQPGGGAKQQRHHGHDRQIYNIGDSLGSSSMNLRPNIAAALSYAGWWITGLVFFLGERRNRFVRFHAMQSILIFVVISIVWTLLKLIFSLPIIGLVGCFLGPLLGFATFVIWAGLIVMALLGREVHVPIIGTIAARLAGQNKPL
jgi:uncharacterized membrane protein